MSETFHSPEQMLNLATRAGLFEWLYVPGLVWTFEQSLKVDHTFGLIRNPSAK